VAIRKEVQELIDMMRSPATARGRKNEIFKTLKSVYKMTPYEILALLKDPSVLEHRMDNKHLLLEDNK